MSDAPVRRWSLAILLAALAMLGPLSVDTYLPAFHAIGQEFNAPQLAVQQTLSAYLFAYAFMMLWHGALADALGRRPVVIAGLGVFAITTLGCAIAGNIETLWLFRALQGVCAGTGLVVGRAIIRDRFHGAEAQRLMSQITLVFGIAPAVAPVLGVMLGAAISGRVAGRMSPFRTVRLGYALMFSGVAFDLVVAWFVTPGVPWHVLPIMLYTMGSAVAAPSVTLLMLDLFPSMRGLASSLQGFFHFSLAAVNAGSIAPLLARSLKALAMGMAGFTLASLFLWLPYLRRLPASNRS